MEKLQNIKLLRVLACIGVFMVHVGQRLEFSGILQKLSNFGSQGVYLFFLISGIVAFLSVNKNKYNMNWKSYFINRAIKILPTYYIIILYNYILHTFFLKDVPTDPTSLGWIRYILCLNRIIPSGIVFWDNLSATWTISSFLFFYLLVPVLYKFIHNSKTAFVTFLLVHVITNAFDWPEPIEMLQFFLLGIFLYYIIIEHRDWQFITLAICYIMIYGVIESTWTDTIFVIIFSIIIISTRELKIKNQFVKRLVDWIDIYSYTIYLVHAVVIEWFDRTKYNYFFWQYKIMSFLIILLVTLMGSILVHNMINFIFSKIYCRKTNL